MQYLALATDYDGTLAKDGHVDAQTIDALKRWRDSGRKVILITGRQLDDFLNIFSEMELFDRVVAENGAAIYRPADRSVLLLGEPPSEEFKQRLRDRIFNAEQNQSVSGEFKHLATDRILEFGRVIAATWTPHDLTVKEVMQEMGLNHLQVIMNKGAVMVLPIGVDKASGLKVALEELNLPLETVVGVGDAENDMAFLGLCGYSVAVANALSSVKEAVDWVTEGSRGAGVTELIDRLL
ncbi:MAG: HAD family phosphatase [Cyanobacteria bacterium CRU_2_1]|nr:HAD family phosphatase [Cyanobacteria bacterium RU_5_0]NJR63107.1 HAD family phosphatase [Cyanobacteria bacterium CRU_2_1]